MNDSFFGNFHSASASAISPSPSSISFMLPLTLTLTPPRLCFIVDKVKAANLTSTSTSRTPPVASAAAAAGGRWRQHRHGIRRRPNPTERHSPSHVAAAASPPPPPPHTLPPPSKRVTISRSRRLSFSALIEPTVVSHQTPEIASFTLTGKSVAITTSHPFTSPPSIHRPSKYFKLCSQILVSARRKSTSGSISAVPVTRRKKSRSTTTTATVTVRVVSKIKKQVREKAAISASRGNGRPRSYKAPPLMLKKKAFPVHQKVISDPCQFNVATAADSDCDYDDVQKAVKFVLKSKVMLIGADQSLSAFNNKVNVGGGGGNENEVTVSAEFLANTYDFYHQRHVDNLKSMIAEHAIQQDESFCQQPERKKIHIREDFYCEPDFLMDTEQNRPLSGSTDSSINEDSMDLLSEDIDKCRIHDQKIKPKITFTHVTAADFNKAKTDGSSEKSSKVSSPLLEVPSLFLDLSSEMLRPPLGNM